MGGECPSLPLHRTWPIGRLAYYDIKTTQMPSRLPLFGWINGMGELGELKEAPQSKSRVRRKDHRLRCPRQGLGNIVGGMRVTQQSGGCLKCDCF